MSQALGIDVEVGPSTFNRAPDHYVMRVGVQAKKIDASRRDPVHLTFLVDTSRSMSQDLPNVPSYLRMMLDRLKRGDTMALATYAGDTKILL